jgi:hypothetical protein
MEEGVTEEEVMGVIVVVVETTGTAEEATEEVMADTAEVEVMVVEAEVPEVENDRAQNKNVISAAIQDIFQTMSNKKVIITMPILN